MADSSSGITNEFIVQKYEIVLSFICYHFLVSCFLIYWLMGEKAPQQVVKVLEISNFGITNEIIIQKYGTARSFVCFEVLKFWWILNKIFLRGCLSMWSRFENFVSLI